MNVELWPIDRVIPYARNPRNNDDAIATVAASLAEFGWRQPIVVDDDGVIIVGHTRLKAAKQLGMTEVPVHVASGLTPAQVRAYRIMDNRSNENASWDNELLKLEFDDLRLEGFNLELTGFDSSAISGIESIGTFEPESSTQEIDPDDYQMNTRCPRCGFEFDEQA